jgi:hypothetical protein
MTAGKKWRRSSVKTWSGVRADTAPGVLDRDESYFGRDSDMRGAVPNRVSDSPVAMNPTVS